MLAVLLEVFVMVLEVVVLAGTSPAEAAPALVDGAVGTVGLLGLHELYLGVELAPAGQPGVDNVLEVPEGEGSLGDAGGDEDLSILEHALLLLLGHPRSQRVG